MLGAIIGDIIGAPYEYQRADSGFPLFSEASDFTDDTVMTIAIADALINGLGYGPTMQKWGQMYPDRGYGDHFYSWLKSRDPKPYNSYGNGSAMRAGPIGWFFFDENEVLEEAARSAMVSHNHPEGVRGAQATALAVFLAKKGISKEEMREVLQKRFDYNLSRTLEEIRPGYSFNETCQGTVPEAMICFLESTDFESAIRNAVTLGGDSDTLACITGAIAEAFYKHIPQSMIDAAWQKIPDEMREVVQSFIAGGFMPEYYKPLRGNPL